MNIAYVMLITGIVVGSQFLIYSKFGLRRLSYSRYFDRSDVFAGEEIEMVEVITNRKLLPLPWLRLESSIHAHLRFNKQGNDHETDISEGRIFQNHRSLFSLLPYMRITRRHRVLCAKRGLYRLQTASLTCGDLLGMVRKSQTLQLSLELVVYPNPAPLEQVPLPSHSWFGDVIVRRFIVEDPFLIAGVRPYRQGDSLRHVNWQATARTNELQVHQHDYSADHRLLIYVNTEITELMWGAVTEPERIEKGIEYAAALVEWAVHQGMEVGFGSNGWLVDWPKLPVRVPVKSGREHMMTIYDTMARLTIARSLPFDAFLEQDAQQGLRNADVVLITCFVSDDIQRQINRLHDLGNRVTVIPLEPIDKNQAG